MSDDLSANLASLRINRDSPPPSGIRWGRWLTVGALLVGVLFASLFVVPALSARVYQTEVTMSEIRLMSPAGASVQVTSTGYVVAQNTSKVGARIAGRVAEVRVKEGDTVEAGAVLATLDDAEQRAAIAAARARTAAARARALGARATLAETSRQLAREQELAAQGASARSIAEDLAVRVQAQREAAEAAEADANAAVAEQRALEVNLGYLTVTAPIPGRVVTRPVSIGELVGPVGAPVAELADFSSLLVETDVPEARVALVVPGGPAEIVLDAYPSVRHRGRVVDLSPKVNRTKATVIVKVAFVDPIEGVLPEMAARVGFLDKELDAEAMAEPPKLFVAGAAIVERGTSRFVYQIQDGKVREVPVTLGAALGAGFVLLEGPPAGARVITNPPPQLADGYPVRESTKKDE